MTTAALPTTAVEALQRLCPPLYALGEDTYSWWLVDAASQLTTAAGGWGNQYYQAVALLAAHNWFSLTGGSAAGLPATAAKVTGEIASESVSNGVTQVTLNRSYVQIQGAKTLEEAYLKSTAYGLRFLSIRGTRPAFGARSLASPTS